MRLRGAFVAAGVGAAVLVGGATPAPAEPTDRCTATGELSWTDYGSFILVHLTAASPDAVCAPYLGDDGSVTMFGFASEVGSCSGGDTLHGLGLVDHSTNTWFSQREGVPFPGPVPIGGRWEMVNDDGSGTEYRADVAISTRIGGLCPPEGSPAATLRFVPLADRPSLPVSTVPRAPLCAVNGAFRLEDAVAPTQYVPIWSVPFRLESIDTRCASLLGPNGRMSGSLSSPELGRCSGGLTAQFHGVGHPEAVAPNLRRVFSQVAEMPFPGPVVGTVSYESEQVPFAMITRLAGQCPPAGDSEALWLFGLPS